MQPTPIFDRTLSLRLDRIILAIEAGPPAMQRLALRLAKRYCERAVPSFGKAVQG